MIVETRIERVLRRHGLEIADLAVPGGAEGRLVREALPAEQSEALRVARLHLHEDYERLARGAGSLDPTLERSALAARNAALDRLARLERSSDTITRQIARARSALYPGGKPQERVLTIASFLMRYGPGLLDDVAAEVAHGMGAS
jgi:uncharacterized protein YllA (UPF0747 family)